MKRKLLSSERVVKHYTFEAKAINEDEHIVEGIFSTASEDRHGEVVVQEGWKLDDYIKNPVVLWSHDNYQFPLAQMIRIGFENGNLAGAMKFAVEEYPVAATAFALMKGKYLRAFSVGFMNNVYEIDQQNETVKLVENVLLEVSVVNVPAQAEALAKIKSIDVLKKEEVEENKDEKEADDKLESEITKSVKQNIQKQIRADKPIAQKVKVETPPGKGGRYSSRNINKVIRQLLKRKQSINS